MNAFFKVVGVALLLQLTTLGASQVAAGETELAVLTSYVGNWQGEGALVGGDQPEPFRCRLTIAKGNQSIVDQGIAVRHVLEVARGAAVHGRVIDE